MSRILILHEEEVKPRLYLGDPTSASGVYLSSIPQMNHAFDVTADL